MRPKDVLSDIERTVKWLRDMVKETGTEGLLVGVSGGIDSAVVAFLLKKALPDNSLGVILPCASCGEDIRDANEVVMACGIHAYTFDITPIHRALADMIMPQIRGTGGIKASNGRAAEANLKARLRMGALYTVANALNYLVVGTDNAAEIYTGYFTKYGDGGVDILPVANITKREIRLWAEALGVPQRIIGKVPTAGLWEGQTDEAEMGTSYDMVDDYLEGKSIPQRDYDIIESLHKRSEHKRKLPLKPPAEWYR